MNRVARLPVAEITCDYRNRLGPLGVSFFPVSRCSHRRVRSKYFVGFWEFAMAAAAAKRHIGERDRVEKWADHTSVSREDRKCTFSRRASPRNRKHTNARAHTRNGHVGGDERTSLSPEGTPNFAAEALASALRATGDKTGSNRRASKQKLPLGIY